jgi:hypothetical protein
MHRFAGAAMAVAAAALAGVHGVTAASTAGWSIQPTKSTSSQPSSRLNGVSCSSETACIAVGGSPASPGFAFAARWNGAKWEPLPMSQPAGATSSTLSGVSCSSASACTAVGSYTNGSGQVLTLAERWDGTAWTMQPTPSPGSYAPQLYGVSCPSATNCTAVGTYQADAGGPNVSLAESWNGTTWSVVATPNSTAAGSWSQLSDVSCVSTKACVAAGFSTDASGLEHALGERWNGTAWSIQSLPAPTGFNQSWLSGVSCVSTSRCTAVGSKASSSQTLPLAEHWNGQAWSIESTAGGIAGELQGVSCSDTTACTAVGMHQVVSGTWVPFAMDWNGKWSTVTTPNPAGRVFAALMSVSCVSAGTCEAVGYSMNSHGVDFTLAEGNST